MEHLPMGLTLGATSAILCMRHRVEVNDAGVDIQPQKMYHVTSGRGDFRVGTPPHVAVRDGQGCRSLTIALRCGIVNDMISYSWR